MSADHQFGNGSLFLARFDPAGTLVWQRTWGENGSNAPPHVFDSVSNSSRNADATSTDAISTAPNPSGTVNTNPGAVVTTPIGSETYAGDTEAFFLRLQR